MPSAAAIETITGRDRLASALLIGRQPTATISSAAHRHVTTGSSGPSIKPVTSSAKTAAARRRRSCRGASEPGTDDTK